MPEHPAISKLRQLHEAATTGPWESMPDPHDPRDWLIMSPEHVVIRETRAWFWNDPPRKDEADMALMAAAVNALPALLDCAEMFERWAPRYHSPLCKSATLPPEFGGPEDRACDCGKSAADEALAGLAEMGGEK